MKAHDPMVQSLPEELSQIELCADSGETLRDADALVVSTEWPEYKTALVPRGMTVIDANRFLAYREGLRYFSVGMPAT